MAETFYPHTVAQQLDCDEEAFGTLLAREIPLDTPPEALPRLAKKYIAILQRDIRQLVSSKDPSDQKTVKKMDEYFQLYDRPVVDPNKIPVDAIMSWLAQASYNDFTEFAQLNTYHNDRATQALTIHQPHLEHFVMDRTERFVDVGLFPKIALSSMYSAVQKNRKIRVMDTFEAGANHSAGYSEKGSLVLANLTDLSMETVLASPPAEFRQTIYHEFLHCAAYAGQCGFETLSTENLPLSWENEAFAEYHACLDPDMTVTAYPFEPLSDYYEQEYQLSALALQGVAPDLLAEAFFSQAGSAARHDVERKMKQYFATISPSSIENPLAHFSAAYEESESSGSAKATAIVDDYYVRAGVTY